MCVNWVKLDILVGWCNHRQPPVLWNGLYSVYGVKSIIFTLSLVVEPKLKGWAEFNYLCYVTGRTWRELSETHHLPQSDLPPRVCPSRSTHYPNPHPLQHLSLHQSRLPCHRQRWISSYRLPLYQTPPHHLRPWLVQSLLIHSSSRRA